MGAWTREDWNNIIRQVNDLAQNPDDGCDPVSPLEEVGPDHIWTKTDINDVRNKLIEICGDNSFSAELRLWAQDIIDEINDAIAAGWCDCNPCADQCDNAQGIMETYGGAFEVTACRNCGGDCGHPTCEDTCTYENRQAATSAGDTAVSKMGDWADAWVEYCALKKEVEKLQDQLDALNDQLDALEEARDDACANGTPEECSAAQAAVDAKQADVDAKQDEVDEKTEERDEKKGEADGYEAEADAAAAESMSLADAVGAEKNLVPYTAFIVGDGAWTNTECDGWGPPCLGYDASRCKVSWTVMQKTTYLFSGGGTWEGTWQTQMGGGFTRAGNPYVAYIRACGGVPKYACSACGPNACENGCNPTQIYEIKSVTAYPYPYGEECCDDDGGA